MLTLILIFALATGDGGVAFTSQQVPNFTSLEACITEGKKVAEQLRHKVPVKRWSHSETPMGALDITASFSCLKVSGNKG